MKMDKGIEGTREYQRLEEMIKYTVNITVEKHNAVLIRSLKTLLETLEEEMIELAKQHIAELIVVLEMGEEE
jgi:hypothetical protein